MSWNSVGRARARTIERAVSDLVGVDRRRRLSTIAQLQSLLPDPRIKATQQFQSYYDKMVSKSFKSTPQTFDADSDKVSHKAMGTTPHHHRLKPAPFGASDWGRNRRFFSSKSSRSSFSSTPTSSTTTNLAKHPPEPSFVIAKVRYDGTMSIKNLPPSEILKRTAVLPRDLVSLNLTARQERLVNKDRSLLRPPTAILPRCESILLSFGNVRAIGASDAVYVFDAHDPAARSFAKELATIYQQSPLLANFYGTMEPPELIFLEAVLQDTVYSFQRRIRLYEPIVQDFLTRVETQVFSDSFVHHQLVPLKDSLQSFELHVKQCYTCLTEVLNDDELMLELLLTEQQHAKTSGTPVPLERHTHIELLVGGYARQISNISMEIGFLLKRLQSKQEFVALALASQRNRYVRINVLIGITGVAVGLATTIAGFYGMNLLSGLEESPLAFYYVVIGSTLTSAAGAIGCLSFLSGKAMQQRAAASLKDIETLSGALEEMEALDYTIKQAMQRNRALNKQQFKNELLKRRTVSDDEVDLLFSILDVTGDGELSGVDFGPGLLGQAPISIPKTPSATKKEAADAEYVKPWWHEELLKTQEAK